MSKIKTGVLVGSQRRQSFSMAVAKTLGQLMPDDFEMKIMDIAHLPMFNQDYDDDGSTPAVWQEFRNDVRALDACLFVTPEYNRSVPPVLKNAIDIASRPFGQNAWDGKPAATISVSPGKPGAFGANQHLRSTLSFLNLYLMNQPEVYLGGADRFVEGGVVTDEGVLGFLRQVAEAYAAWVKRFV